MRLSITSIDRAEVLRYLGYDGQAMDEGLSARIDGMIARCLKTCRPAGVWRVFEVAGTGDMAGDMAGPAERGDRADAVPEMSLHGCSLVLRGRDITSHLAGARQVGVMACTLGMDSERELRALSRRDPLDGLIFDAACTALVERAADAVEAQLIAYAHAGGLYANARFSPGYGDWGLDAQRALLAALDAQRQLGLTLTSTCLLVPTKSVTAALGLFDTPQATGKSLCPKCLCREFCTIRTTGRTCRG